MPSYVKCDSCGIDYQPGMAWHRSGNLEICNTCRLERLRARDHHARNRELREKAEQPEWVTRAIEEPPPDGRTANLIPLPDGTNGGYIETLEATVAQLLAAAREAAQLIRHLRPQCDHHGEYIHLVDAMKRAEKVLGER